MYEVLKNIINTKWKPLTKNFSFTKICLRFFIIRRKQFKRSRSSTTEGQDKTISSLSDDTHTLINGIDVIFFQKDCLLFNFKQLFFHYHALTMRNFCLIIDLNISRVFTNISQETGPVTVFMIL